MAERRAMWTGIRKAVGPAVVLTVAALGLTACGGSAGETTTRERPPVAAATADRLATLSDRIATDLDSGDLCHAAHAADDLQTAVEEADLPANLRPGIETVATDLVNQVNCPAPPPPPEPEKKPKKPKPPKPPKGDEHGNGGQHDNGNGKDKGPGHSDHGGVVPPGQAQLGGEG